MSSRIVIKFLCLLLPGLISVVADAVPTAGIKGITEAPPLFQAIVAGNAASLRDLLQHGADPNEKTLWGWAPLHQAMFAQPEIAKILIEAGADVNSRVDDVAGMRSNGWTPLFFAVTQERLDLAASLINHGADVNILDADGHPALFYAMQRRQKEVVDLLLKSGARPPAQPPAAVTPTPAMMYFGGPSPHAAPIPELYQAVRMHDVAKAEALLKAGANPNERSPGGWAPLHQAMDSNLDMVRLLILYGADVNARVAEPYPHSSKWTPLFFAVYDGRSDLVGELLKHGAEVNLKDSKGRSPLEYAKERKQQAVGELLIKAGARNRE